MSLVDNNVLPLEFCESIHADPNSLKCRNANVKVSGSQLGFDDFFPGLLSCDQVANLDVRAPAAELLHPVADDRLWHQDQVVAIYILELAKERNERDRLDSLAKTHLVSKNAVNASLVQTNHPV